MAQSHSVHINEWMCPYHLVNLFQGKQNDVATHETPLFAHLQICTDNELFIEGAGMTGLDFNDNQAMTLDHVTTKVVTPMLLEQEQEPRKGWN